MTTVLVAGATGALGSRIVRRLGESGAVVRALVRSRRQWPAIAGVELVRGDLEAPGTLAEAVAGANVVVSTATAFPRDSRPDAVERVDRNGTIALAEAAEAAGVGRFVFVSFRPVLHRFPLQDAKRAVEDRLLRCSFEAVVLRPGKFMDIWFSPLCGFDVQEARVQLFGRGQSPVSWIAAADVAELACRAALSSQSQPEVLELGGPEPLSQREVVRIFEQVTGRPFVVDEIPREELERRHRNGADATSVSLAALMLEADDGAVADLEPMLALHPMELTTVADFAATRLRR